MKSLSIGSVCASIINVYFEFDTNISQGEAYKTVHCVDVIHKNVEKWEVP